MSAPALVYYFEEPLAGQPVIYLAGPTWHAIGDQPWQEKAASCLKQLGHTGAICIPMPRDGQWRDEDADAQIDWQLRMQELAGVVVFWIPRPGWVTYIEFGDWYRSGKVVLGVPPGVDKTGYPLHLARRHGVPTATSLDEAMVAAVKLLG
jgi:hypothetical protein